MWSWVMLGGHDDLPIAFSEVECRDEPGPPQLLNLLGHVRHGIAIKLQDLAELLEVIIQAQLWCWAKGSSIPQ